MLEATKSGLAAPIPIVMFSHGLLSYGDWFPFLANALPMNGYIFGTMIDYQGPDISGPYDYACDLTFLLQEVSKDPNFPLYPNINASAAAVGGHSEGGAGAFIAGNPTNLLPIQYNATFKSAFTFSGCFGGDIPYINDCCKKDTIPWLVYAAHLDCLCTVAIEQELYGSLASPCKFYVDMINATHCAYMDAPEIFMEACWAAEELNGFCHLGHDLLTVSQQTALQVKYLLPFLDYTLKNDLTGKQKLLDIMTQDTKDQIILSTYSCQ
jgi:predicted dienelactone hydrolase